MKKPRQMMDIVSKWRNMVAVDRIFPMPMMIPFIGVPMWDLVVLASCPFPVWTSKCGAAGLFLFARLFPSLLPISV